MGYPTGPQEQDGWHGLIVICLHTQNSQDWKVMLDYTKLNTHMRPSM